MSAIIGLDLSLTSTGLARITSSDGRWLAETEHCPSKPLGPTVADRATRIRRIAATVLDFALPCSLAVIEAPIFGGSFGAGTFERGWLWGAVVSRLHVRGVPIIDIAPKTRSAFSAASGGADKAAVALAVGRMWPTWTPGHPSGVNDQADALVLASIGVVLAGHVPPFPMPDYRTKALNKTRRLKDVA